MVGQRGSDLFTWLVSVEVAPIFRLIKSMFSARRDCRLLALPESRFKIDKLQLKKRAFSEQHSPNKKSRTISERFGVEQRKLGHLTEFAELFCDPKSGLPVKRGLSSVNAFASLLRQTEQQSLHCKRKLMISPIIK